MSLILKPGTSWDEVYSQCVRIAPEAFHDDRLLNHFGGGWSRAGEPMPATTPVDGSTIAGPPFLDFDVAGRAVVAAVDQHIEWRNVPLAERKARVSEALDALTGSAPPAT